MFYARILKVRKHISVIMNILVQSVLVRLSKLFYENHGKNEVYSLVQGCILAGISFLSISSILLPTRKSGIRRDKYLSAAIFKEAVHSDDS